MAKKQTTEIVKKEAPGALASWEEEVALEAKADAARFQQGVQRVSFQGGNITIDGNKAKDNKLVVAVIEAVNSKAYYTGDFDPGVPQTPVCYAFHPNDPSKMVPHEAAPEKQASQCVGCKWNKFGTAERGNGKRCKDEIRLMCVVPAGGGSLPLAEVRMVTIPPGSLKNWGDYVNRLRDMGATFRSVLTELSVEPYKGAYKIAFNPSGKLEEKQYGALKARRESAVEQAMQPYPVLEMAEERPKKGKRKFD